MGVLRWPPAQLSRQELSFLCRFARAIVLDPAPVEEVSHLPGFLAWVYPLLTKWSLPPQRARNKNSTADVVNPSF